MQVDSAMDYPLVHGGSISTPPRYYGKNTGSEGTSTPSTGISPQILNYHEETLTLFQREFRPNKIACIGAGYVGGPTMAKIAEKCPDITVHVVDISEERINLWNSDTLPVYETGLQDIVNKCRGKNLFFSTNVSDAVKNCDIIFVCVNTPTKTFGIGRGKAADLTAWELAARTIARCAESPKIVIEKSTVPVRTAEGLKRILESASTHPNTRFLIVSNPEFLAEGTAMHDLEYPDRVLVGGREDTADGQWAIQQIVNIYKRWIDPSKILVTSLWSSELSKLVANAMLAQRVSSVNAIAMLCEKTGADVRQICQSVGADSRIGPRYLNASVGFGGSCLQKDVLSLAYLCDFYGLHEAAKFWESIKDMNDLQKSRFTQRIIHGLFDTVRKKRLAIFGFAFKKNTADIRVTAALDVCAALMTDGAELHVYDPQVLAEDAYREMRLRNLTSNNVFDIDSQFFVEATPLDAVKNSHAIIILTEWDVFRTYDYKCFFSCMTHPAFIFDGRNLLDHSHLAKLGFEVHGVGVPSKYPPSPGFVSFLNL